MVGLEPIYLSYFMPWSGVHNNVVAKAYGFKELCGWESREGYIEQYDQIDAIGYLVHCWMKYPKYGHARATDVASCWIRDGIIDRERAMELVRNNDSKLDERIRNMFCDFCGYTPKEFYDIVLKHKADYVKLTKSDVFGSCERDVIPAPRQECLPM